MPGPGTEPGEGRPYQPGDDVRRIDWNLTARTAVPHVRDTIADRELEHVGRRRPLAEPRLRHRGA